jgi:hypothetical protein
MNIISLTDLKKALYKEKPFARFISETPENKIYQTELSDGRVISFKIPLEEAITFNSSEPSQLLIRWLV